jgi:hypothetical protein
MIEIGRYQELVIRRMVEFGAYLSSGDDESAEVLLPRRYLTDDMRPGETVRVFVYKDSEDRPVATTEKPYATVGQFAYLAVTAVNDTGAFLDWGLSKDLLVPYSEQRSRMHRGGIYLVYVYLDKTTGRVVASAKVDKFLGNVMPDYKVGQEVEALVTEHVEIGYKAIVDNLHRGIIYANEIYKPIEVEQHIRAWVKQVRDDGKIDLTVNDRADRRTAQLADRVLSYLAQPDALALSDKMPPAHIEMLFQCSKKDFKKAVGHLYKDRKIAIGADGTIVRI